MQPGGHSTREPCPLSKALAYENLEIVQRFVQLYDVGVDEAADIFTETKKWLWLAGQEDSRELAITDPLLIIDEMWHNFVLFTLDYTQYCVDCFGHYLHHAPTTQQEKNRRRQAFKDDPVRATEEYASGLQRQCALIAAKLGGATLLKWYVDYPARYDTAFFAERRKAVSMSFPPSALLQSLAAHVRDGRVEITSGDVP